MLKTLPDVSNARTTPRMSISATHTTEVTSVAQQQSALTPESRVQAPGHHNSHNELMKHLSNAGRGYQEVCLVGNLVNSIPD